MCDLGCDNLIDLSLDDDVSSNNTQIKAKYCEKLSSATAQFVPPSWSKLDSLESDPFDCVEKLADRLNDPFDSLEKEACLKAKQASKEPTAIKLANLLSLSDDNLLDGQTMLTHSNLGTINMQELDFESPPVAFDENYSQESLGEIDSVTTNCSSEISASSKLMKNLDYSKRLLKLSISNAAISSPTFCKQSKEFENILGTPISSVLSKAAAFGENLLSAESPLKLVEDEDISEEPKSFRDLEKKFEADLEMLNIPILNELPSVDTEHISYKNIEHDVNIRHLDSKYNQPNLETIKTILNEKKLEINKNKQNEITSLIQNLKTLISCDAMEDKSKRKASDLLESLTSNLDTLTKQVPIPNSDKLAVPPHPIIRQGTFDLDLQEKSEDKQHLLQELPSCMVNSSATYDGETSMEEQAFNLPKITPLSPHLPTPYRGSMQTDLNDILEQLSKLLINNSADKESGINNPTFIVVMNTNQSNNSSIDNFKHDIVDAFEADNLENSINNSSPDVTKLNSWPRLRSQSLSIHDKIKIVQLPLQYSALHPIQKQQSVQLDKTPPMKTTPPSNGVKISEFKTPARLRCNSYSNGIPYTAQVGLRRTGFGTETKNFSHMQKVQSLDTHHECQQHAIVRPLSNNLPSFKPDLRKKAKPNNGSVMKLSGPLKATIPIKKVAPMLKSFPPTPERYIKSKIINTPTTLTPTKGVCKLDEGVGYPNACSTPAAFASPVKRTTTPMNKPRYISVTPNSKTSVINSTLGNVKRRTIADFKSKSPLKPRISNVGSQAATATSFRVPIGNSRLSISAGAKTPGKASAKSAPVKPTSRLTSRLSVGSSLLTNRNKENDRI